MTEPSITPPRSGPKPSGETLIAFDRDQKSKRLRLSLETVEGTTTRYLALRMWDRGDGGNLFPTPKGVSVRLHEVPELIQALQRVVAEQGSDPRVRDRQDPRRDLSQSRPVLNNRNNCSQSQPKPTREGNVHHGSHDDRPQFVDRRRRTEVVPAERRQGFPTPTPSPTAYDEEDIPF